MNTKTEIVNGLQLPGGRFVAGSMTEKETQDYDKKPLAPEDQEYFFQVAVPKTDPNVNNVLAQMNQIALDAYQTSPVVLGKVQQWLAATGFSWKIADGDVPTIDRKTGQYRDIPEYRQGCYIFTFRTKYAPDAAMLTPDQRLEQIAASEIKRGDYVEISFSCGANGRLDDNAGIMVWPNAVLLIGRGEAITGTVSAMNAFANRVGVAQHMGTVPTTVPTGTMPAAAPPAAPAPVAAPPAAMPVAAPPAAMPVAAPPAAMPVAAPPAAMPVAPTMAHASPAPTQMPPVAQPVAAGGHPGMAPPPVAAQAPSTASGIDPQTGLPVQPHAAILQAPGVAPQ